MKGLTVRLIVAALTFAIGIIAAGLWIFNRHQESKPIKSQMLVESKGNYPAPPLSQVTISSRWKKVELTHFSFYVPPKMKALKVQGIDSAVWRYISKDVELTIDLGFYSGKPAIYEDEPEYREEQVKIDGKNAVLCFFRFNEPFDGKRPYVAAVYFSDIGMEETKLSFFASCKTHSEQKTAETIFRSIKFERLNSGKHRSAGFGEA